VTDLGPNLNLSTLHRTPHGWPLRQLRVPQAHRVTRGSPEVTVAVVDLGYTPHPHHEGHLWVNAKPRKGDVHGWDCADDDASLEPAGPGAETPYYRDHHCIIVGEVIACAPECRVMVVRVGYRAPKDNWARGIEYAVEHGARVLVMPHGFISHGRTASAVPLFYRGTDFSAPVDNPRLRQTLEAAYDAGCLICCGVIDNRGRRAAFPTTALDCVMAVGSSSRHGGAADIAPDADYVEVAAPAGDRGTDEDLDRVWSTGGHGGYVASEGGCMASGFAGGVAALVWSRFPELTNDQLRQVLRSTANGPGASDSKLGWGILDAAAAVRLKPGQLRQDLRVSAAESRVRDGGLSLRLENRGAFDIQRALVVAYNGDPERAAAPRATFDRPVTLLTRQVGHAIGPVRGLSGTELALALTEPPGDALWVQACVLDRHGSEAIVTTRVH
jgi:subtilisin family serine protease